MLTPEQAREWQDAAMYLAQRGYTGKQGDPLPNLLSSIVIDEIANYPEEFQREVRAAAYLLARTRCSGRV